MNLLMVNAGSSSTKVTVLDEDDHALADIKLPAPGHPVTADGLRRLLESFPIGATGHRIVHGGSMFTHPVVVEPRVEKRLADLADLAPLHNAPALKLLDEVRRWYPELPAVACFDTTFFADMPEAMSTYAIPAEWRQVNGIRRYGFHGLSHSYSTRRAAKLSGRGPGQMRFVSAHLGAGASVAAVSQGRGVDSTMGFTPLEGLVMATRSGSVDPGALTWLLRKTGISPEKLEDALERHSGLLALAGTPNLAQVIDDAGLGHAAARLALDVYLHRLCAGIASMATSLGGMDVLGFTGGAGQASASLRWLACQRLAFLGVQLNPDANEEATAGGGDAVISSRGEPVLVVVIQSREDLEMAGQVRTVLSRA